MSSFESQSQLSRKPRESQVAGAGLSRWGGRWSLGCSSMDVWHGHEVVLEGSQKSSKIIKHIK